MATRIRLSRHGRKKQAFYHIVVSDQRSPRDGKFIEKLVEKNNCEIIELYEFDYPLKNSMPFHSKDTKVENAILYHIASLPK